ncbi:hypothetical protein [Candidatus Hodgkinia cicadicola]|uniref:hypothetical protein n=1 Tax=Candidatus Hodgkinia cicadicola TaxID=573658 RepID=UPI002415192E
MLPTFGWVWDVWVLGFGLVLRLLEVELWVVLEVRRWHRMWMRVLILDEIL